MSLKNTIWKGNRKTVQKQGLQEVTFSFAVQEAAAYTIFTHPTPNPSLGLKGAAIVSIHSKP